MYKVNNKDTETTPGILYPVRFSGVFKGYKMKVLARNELQ